MSPEDAIILVLAQQALLSLSNLPRPNMSFLYAMIPTEITASKLWDTSNCSTFEGGGVVQWKDTCHTDVGSWAGAPLLQKLCKPLDQKKKKRLFVLSHWFAFPSTNLPRSRKSSSGRRKLRCVCSQLHCSFSANEQVYVENCRPVVVNSRIWGENRAREGGRERRREWETDKQRYREIENQPLGLSCNSQFC